MVEDGQYSSKSGYRFLKEEEAGPSLEPPTDSAQHLWRNIWSLDVPNRVKHFTWRACKNSLSTKCNLVRRRVISDHHCDRCTASPEHMLHALWTCSEPDVVWEAAEWNFRSRIEVQNFSELLAWIFENGNSAALFCVTAWSIWQQRNQIRNHQNHHSTRHLTRAAADWLAMFSAVQPSPTPRVAASRQTNWIAPAPNVYKINYDGAVSLSSNCSGIGVVIQNNAGLVVASLAQRFCQACKPVEIEAMAATRAIEFAREIGVDRIMVEGDSSTVTKALSTKNPAFASYGLLIEHARVLEENFLEFSYSHKKRGGNKVAHCLVRLALTLFDVAV